MATKEENRHISVTAMLRLSVAEVRAIRSRLETLQFQLERARDWHGKASEKTRSEHGTILTHRETEGGTKITYAHREKPGE